MCCHRAPQFDSSVKFAGGLTVWLDVDGKWSNIMAPTLIVNSRTRVLESEEKAPTPR